MDMALLHNDYGDAALESGLSGAPSRRALYIRASLRKDELFFDRARAEWIFEQLYGWFVSSLFSIEDNAPQWTNRPRQMKEGSLEHFVWIFSAASTDLRSESDVVYSEHRRLWEGDSSSLRFRARHRSSHQLYTPEVLRWNKNDFLWGLARARFGNPKRNIEWWQRRSQTLWEEWNGDPRNMFVHGSIASVMAEKEQKRDWLPGVGPKIASLIAIFFEELGLPKIPDAFPVDVHVQRFCLAQGIIRPIGRLAPVLNETLEEILRPEIAAMCERLGWSRITLSHAIWFRGNRGCTDCWRINDMPRLCPSYQTCRGPLESKPYFKMGLWLLQNPPLPRGGMRKPQFLSEIPDGSAQLGLFSRAGS